MILARSDGPIQRQGRREEGVGPVHLMGLVFSLFRHKAQTIPVLMGVLKKNTPQFLFLKKEKRKTPLIRHFLQS